MRDRAYRRYMRHVKLQRRLRIMSRYGLEDPDGRVMNAHLRCGCWDEPRAQALRRRREDRAWRVAYARGASYR